MKGRLLIITLNYGCKQRLFWANQAIWSVLEEGATWERVEDGGGALGKASTPVCGSKEHGTVRGGTAAGVGGEGRSVRDLFWQPKNFNLVLQHPGPVEVSRQESTTTRFASGDNSSGRHVQKELGGVQTREERSDRMLVPWLIRG